MSDDLEDDTYYWIEWGGRWIVGHWYGGFWWVTGSEVQRDRDDVYRWVKIPKPGESDE